MSIFLIPIVSDRQWLSPTLHRIKNERLIRIVVVGTNFKIRRTQEDNCKDSAL